MGSPSFRRPRSWQQRLRSLPSPSRCVRTPGSRSWWGDRRAGRSGEPPSRPEELQRWERPGRAWRGQWPGHQLVGHRRSRNRSTEIPHWHRCRQRTRAQAPTRRHRHILHGFRRIHHRMRERSP
uniref:IP02613p n=1 Tax=Drosophila melanogaster TaxID=7227 RepID=Q4V3T3_DROME|nr:IP02613p [Drosophila melanogaster]